MAYSRERTVECVVLVSLVPLGASHGIVSFHFAPEVAHSSVAPGVHLQRAAHDWDRGHLREDEEERREGASGIATGVTVFCG